jgi:splicing factor 45
MVAPGTVDDDLAGETKQECERYGPVTSCVVYEEPLGGAVRLFVVFTAQESAVRAFRDLNGRFFAGRQVTASYYDEDKFARRALSREE